MIDNERDSRLPTQSHIDVPSRAPRKMEAKISLKKARRNEARVHPEAVGDARRGDINANIIFIWRQFCSWAYEGSCSCPKFYNMLMWK